MHHFVHAGVLAALMLAMPIDADDVANKVALPDSSSLGKAEKEIRDLYKTEYAKRAPQDRQDLAHKLIELAGTESDPTVRFVLLREASRLAVEGQDYPAALDALRRLGKEYAADLSKDFVELFRTFSRSVKTVGEVQTLMSDILLAAEEETASDHFDGALELLSLASSIAKKNKDSVQTKEIATLRADIQALEKISGQARTAANTLKSDPSDPDANLRVGRYLCTVKQDWERGLPMLASGSDSDLKVIARKELGNPEDPQDQFRLANDWWKQAEPTNGSIKRHLLDRSRHWLTKALPSLSGLQRSQAETRLAEIEKLSAHALSSVPRAVESEEELVLNFGRGILMKFRRIRAASAGQTNLYMGTTEVTQVQWQLLMNSNPSQFRGDPQLPVDSVSWEDAETFLASLQKMPFGKKYRFRIPSAKEWTIAGKAGASTTYFFGSDESKIGEYAWYAENSSGKTRPVGQRKPNAWGLHDVYGNVWELVTEKYEVDGTSNHTARGGASTTKTAEGCNLFLYFRERFKFVGLRVVAEDTGG